MDWFLYNRDLRHERVKSIKVHICHASLQHNNLMTALQNDVRKKNDLTSFPEEIPNIRFEDKGLTCSNLKIQTKELRLSRVCLYC